MRIYYNGTTYGRLYKADARGYLPSCAEGLLLSSDGYALSSSDGYTLLSNELKVTR